MRIEYIFEFQDADKDFLYTIHDPPRIKDNQASRFWTHLEFHRCSNCRLSLEGSVDCPAALNMVDPVEHFSKCSSFDQVALHIVSELERHSVRTDLQTALAYLYPAILAASGCPNAVLLLPYERFGKLFPDADDILFYELSLDLIKGCLAENASMSCGLQPTNYPTQSPSHELALTFQGLLDRLRMASEKDANINAFVKNVFWSHSLNISRDGILERLKQYFPSTDIQ